MNGECNKKKRKQNNKEQSHEKLGEEKPTKATLPIHDKVALVREGGENDGEELGTLFTSISSRHTVFPQRLVLRIGEAIEPTISLEIVTHVVKI
jgi:hypothetical protein